MLYSPRIGAIWARYGNTLIDAGEIESAFEKADDHWDSTDPLTFWLCVIFCPYYPQYQLAIKYHESDNSFLTDHMDTVFYWSMLTKVIRDLLGLLVTMYEICFGERERASRGPHMSHTTFEICVLGEGFFLVIIYLFYCLWSVLGMLLPPHIVGGLSDLVFFSQVYLLVPFLFLIDWVTILILLPKPPDNNCNIFFFKATPFGPLLLPSEVAREKAKPNENEMIIINQVLALENELFNCCLFNEETRAFVNQRGVVPPFRELLLKRQQVREWLEAGGSFAELRQERQHLREWLEERLHRHQHHRS
jgi:hypothetical protein